MMGRDCAVHVHRDDVPLEVHHIHPLGMGGPNTAANKVKLCANGHSAIHEYMRLLAKGKVRWLTARRYGKKVRALATEGLSGAVG